MKATCFYLKAFSVSSHIQNSASVTSSHLYKAVCHRPDTSAPNRPERQITSSHLTITEGGGGTGAQMKPSGSAFTLIRKDEWKMFSTVREKELGSMTNS